jgi:hypothetical protein
MLLSYLMKNLVAYLLTFKCINIMSKITLHLMDHIERLLLQVFVGLLYQSLSVSFKHHTLQGVPKLQVIIYSQS